MALGSQKFNCTDAMAREFEVQVRMAVGSPAACMYGFGFSCHSILRGFFLFFPHRLCFNGMALDFLATQYFWYFFWVS